jgi:hypothetical protein
MSDLSSYPRITLKCHCGNEFNVNVIRMKDRQPVFCQICGEVFPADIAEKFAKAFEDLYKVKYLLDKEGCKFKYAFLYKSTFDQPPAPYPLEDEEDDNMKHLKLKKML